MHRLRQHRIVPAAAFDATGARCGGWCAGELLAREPGRAEQKCEAAEPRSGYQVSFGKAPRTSLGGSYAQQEALPTCEDQFTALVVNGALKPNYASGAVWHELVDLKRRIQRVAGEHRFEESAGLL